jgi:hypothetical protein
MQKSANTLFEHYRRNLNQLVELGYIGMHADLKDGVLCPLCVGKFLGSEHLKGGDLTIEHAPPASLGGKAAVLTCRNCNNRHGHSIDHHLVGYIKGLDALSGGGENFVDVTVTSEGRQFKANFRKSGPQQLELYAVPKASNQKHIIKAQYRVVYQIQIMPN